MKLSALLVLPLVLSLSGCMISSRSQTGGGVEMQGSCADLVRYDGHRYHGHGELQRMPATAGSAGTATRLACDDGNGASPEEDIDVVELSDVPLNRAFLSHGQVYVRDGLDLPAAARGWFEPTRCEDAAPFELTGRWLGVESHRKVRFDGDLRPPYRLTAWVTQGPRAYVDTRVSIARRRPHRPAAGPRRREGVVVGGRRRDRAGALRGGTVRRRRAHHPLTSPGRSRSGIDRRHRCTGSSG